MTLKITITASTLTLTFSAKAYAAFITHTLPGNSSFDGWDDLTTNNPQVNAAASSGSPFPLISKVTAPWPEAINSQVLGSADATFNKTSGGGFPGISNVYTGFATAGSFAVTDNTPVANLETVIFQLDIGFGSGPDFLTNDPVLTINSNTIVPLLTSGILAEAESTGGPLGPINVRSAAFQWDLRGQPPVNSFEIGFTTDGTSSTIWGLQLDQGDQFTLVPVPEPSSAALLALASVALLKRRRS